MKSFALSNPKSLRAASELLAAGPRDPRARKVVLLAGGQDLLTEMKEHLAEPAELVNLKSVPGLDRVEERADGSLAIGALVTLAKLADHPAVRKGWALVAEAARSVASPQIRTFATVGGNLCQRPRCWYYRNEQAKCLKKGGSECFAYGGLNKYNAILGGGPSYIVHPSDLAPALVAAGASATVFGPDGERTVPLERFFTLPAEGSVLKENVLAPAEILTSVVLPPPPPGAASTYLKFKERGSYDFALASVALLVAREGGKTKTARVVLGGVAPIPWRTPAAEAALAGRELDARALEAAAEEALADAEPLEHNAYKVALAKGLIRRAGQVLARA